MLSLPPSVLRAHNSEGSRIFDLFIQTEKAAVSTIKGYRAMLSSVFKFCLPEISSSSILKDLVRSFEISAPRPLHHTPPWDLDKVLEYLSGPPSSLWHKLPFGISPGRHCSS